MRAETLISVSLPLAGVWSYSHHLRTGDVSNQLTVPTTSGKLHGKIEEIFPNVRQFLGIPYARPPVGDLRWVAPEPLSQSDARVEATELAPSCMSGSKYPATPNIYNQELSEGVVFDSPGTSEDCLTLSVHAPTINDSKKEPFPVLIWVHGGGWQGGGVTPYSIPTQWIDRTPSHIVVSIHYRLNIFGFPGGVKAIKDWNLGYLDQRLAVEWVRDNIAAFSGDPSRITLWGESAGAGSVDAYTYAWYKDPIVTGTIQASNPPLIAIFGDRTGANFSSIARNLNCTGDDELACMRNLPAEDVLYALPEVSNEPSIFFYPTVDDKTVFADSSARSLEGKVAKIPAIIGTNKDDGIGNISYDLEGVNETAAHQALLTIFLCPATDIIDTRQRIDLPTYRFVYSGNFSNVSPRPWLGAYHASEIPMLFGTHPNYRGNSTELEYQTSHAMQDAWVAFARDPVNGLEGQEWKPYERLGEKSVREFGADVAARDIGVAKLEEECGARVA